VSWQADKAMAWWPKIKGHAGVAIYRDKDILKKMGMTVTDCDPRKLMERLYEDRNAGKLTINQSPITKKGQPISLLITSKDHPDQRMIYTIEPASKLVQSIEKDQLKDEKYVFVSRILYFDYNKPIGDEIFVLNPPPDTLRADETIPNVGLAKGTLSDNEIATKVVREFLDALMAQDYAKAGNLYMGVPADQAKTLFGSFKLLQIVSMDAPVRVQQMRRSLRVHCRLEMEAHGQKGIKDTYGIFVCPVPSQPDRWAIKGGF
jgi:hypothetical protein